MSKKITALVTAFCLLFQISLPALSAVLPDAEIETDLNNNLQFQRVFNDLKQQYIKAPFFSSITPKAQHIDTFHKTVIDEYPHAVDAPTYVPINVGDITTFIPVYKQFKYVGDSFVQNRYIRAQVSSLLGRNLINSDLASGEYASEVAQLNTLYGNALSYLSNNPALDFGQPLGFHQDGSGLTENIVWPELRTINGEQVIVPIVYLTVGTVENRKVDGHTDGFNGLTTFGTLIVEDVDIQFGRQAFIQVAGDLLNNQSTMTGTNDLTLAVGGTLTNLSGVFQANGDLKIGAHGINSQTVVHRYDLGGEQGTRFGEIASFDSITGDVTLRSYSDILLQGVNVSAMEGGITFAANGNIYIGSQHVSSTSSGTENGWNVDSSNVDYLQSSLTANETIQLIANGQIVIDAAEIVSDQGHIDLLAGLGITIDSDLSQSQTSQHGKFGSTSKEVSVYKTVAMRALLDAGKGINIHSEFGDISLKSADITSVDGTTVTATNGGVNMLMTTETDHYSYSSVSENLFTTTTKQRGHSIETGVPNTIVGGFAVEALTGVQVEYEGDTNLSIDDQIAVLATFEGMEWMANVRANTTDVDWTSIDLQYQTWNESNTSITPAFAAVISIAVAIYTGGVGAELLLSNAMQGGVIAASVSAGFTAITTQVAISLANGNSIAATLESLSEKDSLRSLAISMATAGALAKLDSTEFFSLGDNADLVDQATYAVTAATVRAGIEVTVQGGDFDDFEDSFVQNLAQHSINVLGEALAKEIGDAKALYKIDPTLGIDTATQYIAHAAVGCLTGDLNARLQGGEAELGCFSGAGGAVIGEYIGQQYEDDLKSDVKEWVDGKISGGVQLSNDEIYQQALNFKQRGVDVAKLGAALSAFVTGADVSIAAASGANAAENNAIFTTIVILATIGYTAWVGDGNLYEGLQKIGIGTDPLSSAMQAGTTAAVEWASDEFPEATQDVFEVLSAVDESVTAGVKIVMETEAGVIVERYWNDLPQEQRNAIIGFGKTVTFIIPAATITKLNTLKNLEVEAGDWLKDPSHENWAQVSETDREVLQAPLYGMHAARGNIQHHDAGEINSTFPSDYEPPYLPGTLVTEFDALYDVIYVRVHGELNKERSWMMKAEDIAGLTPQQIQSKYALPQAPLYVSEVHVPAGTRIREGIVNPVFGGEGNSMQYELVDRLPSASYTNTMPIRVP